MIVQRFLEEISGLEQHPTALAVGVPLLGGALVIATSILMARGKAKGLITGAYMFAACIGVSCLLFALAALTQGASVNQVSPALLIGIVLTVIMGIFTPATIRKYQQLEFRKLAAELFRRS